MDQDDYAKISLIILLKQTIFYSNFQNCICKSLEIRRFTLGHTFFVLFLSITTKLNLLVSLHEEVCIDLNFIYYLLLYLSLSISLLICTMDNRQPVYNIPKLSLFLPHSLSFTLSHSKSSPLIALNTNLQTFSSLFSLKIMH